MLDLIVEIFCCIQDTEVDSHCTEILDKWQQALCNITKEPTVKKEIENVDQKLARLLVSNVRLEETTQACKYTDEELKIREAILSKYSHVCYSTFKIIFPKKHSPEK